MKNNQNKKLLNNINVLYYKHIKERFAEIRERSHNTINLSILAKKRGNTMFIYIQDVKNSHIFSVTSYSQNYRSFFECLDEINNIVKAISQTLFITELSNKYHF